MVSGYIPPGGNKKKLVQESRIHIWEHHTFSEFVQMACSGDVYLLKESKLLKDAFHHHIEDIMGHSAHM
jgi:hypothetical protein